jgi:AAA-like domain/Effector-associated domain 9/CHAT domain
MVIRNILILAANPIDLVRLSLDREVAEIRTTLQLSKNRDRFEIAARGSVRPHELQEYIYDLQPQIVHFSGHGLGEPIAVSEPPSSRKFTVIAEDDSQPQGLMFEDDNGRSKLVSGAAISNLFALFSDRVVCVVLNSCYSASQAQEIVKYIPYVVGMNRAIGDIAARKFSQGFYRAIWDGRSIEEAFMSGKNAIELDGIPEELTPVLLTRSNAAPTLVTSVNPKPENSSSTGGRNSMSDRQRSRLEQERDGLENQYTLLSEKLNRLRDAYAIENDPTTKFKLEKQIEQSESEIATINVKLESIEEKLNNSPQYPTDKTARSMTESINSEPVRSIPITLEEPEGLVALNSPFYIERPPVENRCYEAIECKGALIRIKAPGQMGKSSLMIRIRDRAKQLKYQSVNLNFQIAHDSLLTDLDKFLRWFCASIGQQLGLPRKFDEYWDDEFFTSNDNCTTYFQSYLLNTTATPIVLTLDKVDLIFKYPIAANFFGLLRVWHEMAKSEPIWENMRLIVVHSQEPDIHFDINQSPFHNVGVDIELAEFNQLQVKELAARHRLTWSDLEIEELMAMVGGHPYLVRVALYHTARQYVSFRQLLDKAPTEAGIYRDHLRRNLDRLKHNNLVSAMQLVVASEIPVQLSTDEAFQLDSMGLILRHGNKIMPSCNLYRLYFRDRLGVNG